MKRLNLLKNLLGVPLGVFIATKLPTPVEPAEIPAKVIAASTETKCLSACTFTRMVSG